MNILSQEKIAEKKNRITELIRENTKRLNQLSLLVNDKKFSEGALNSRQKNLVSILISLTQDFLRMKFIFEYRMLLIHGYFFFKIGFASNTELLNVK